jgi:hypothetical protein
MKSEKPTLKIYVASDPCVRGRYKIGIHKGTLKQLYQISK